MSSGWLRNGLVYLLIMVAIAALVFSVFSGSRQSPEVDITQVTADLKKGVVSTVKVQGDILTIEYRDDGTPSRTSRKEPDATVLETFEDLGVTSEQLRNVGIEVESPGAWGNWAGLLITIVPLAIFASLQKSASTLSTARTPAMLRRKSSCRCGFSSWAT